MAISNTLPPYRFLRSFPSLRLSSGLAWMALAQLFFAGMNICTRLGARSLSWAEVASARFRVGAIMAAGLGWVRGSSLRVGDHQRRGAEAFMGRWPRSAPFTRWLPAGL